MAWRFGGTSAAGANGGEALGITAGGGAAVAGASTASAGDSATGTGLFAASAKKNERGEENGTIAGAQKHGCSIRVRFDHARRS
jgi:hypothetical protein